MSSRGPSARPQACPLEALPKQGGCPREGKSELIREQEVHHLGGHGGEDRGQDLRALGLRIISSVAPCALKAVYLSGRAIPPASWGHLYGGSDPLSPLFSPGSGSKRQSEQETHD